jgi:hypothetical protein
MTFSREAIQGVRLPWGYSVAWRDMTRDTVTCLPWGLAQLAAMGRALYIRVQIWRCSDLLEAAYRRGMREGIRLGEQREDYRSWAKAKDDVLIELSRVVREAEE